MWQRVGFGLVESDRMFFCLFFLLAFLVVVVVVVLLY